MQWNKHFNLEGNHAFLGASNYHWINYDKEKLRTVWLNYHAAQKGTEIHEYAEKAIRLGIRQARSKKTVNMYINDAIGFRMTPEVVLAYSDNSFGTCDAISFRDNILRIHDLKTGVTPANILQLRVYAALFCLEYKQKPGEIEIELRIYQNNDILIDRPNAEIIAPIMNKIVTFDKYINQLKKEEVV